MTLDLPAPMNVYLQPLLEVLPLEQAMPNLVLAKPGDPAVLAILERTIHEHRLAGRQAMCAGLYLYVDQLDLSHRISQRLSDATGSFWHGIMHRREGDFANSLYWFHKTGQHPAMRHVGPDYDPSDLVAEAEGAFRRNEEPAALVDLQRREWKALFTWCVEQNR